MNVGDSVSIHYVDIDGIGGSGDIICDGIVVRGKMNGMIRVRYKDEDNGHFETEREFSPHDLKLNADGSATVCSPIEVTALSVVGHFDRTQKVILKHETNKEDVLLIEPLPCPFCGAIAERNDCSKLWRITHAYECYFTSGDNDNHPATHIFIFGDDRIAWWNLRHKEPVINK